MSSEKTPNLQLHKWQAADYVQRTEFNDNFVKIDQHAKQVTEQLADKVNFFETDNTKTKNVSYMIGQQKLFGNTKYSPAIVQQAANDYSIRIVGNESTIEHLKIFNQNKLPNKIGISVDTSQRHHFNDLIIDGYLYGISMKQSYYNYLCDLFIRNCTTAILLGNPDNPSGWVGAMTFDTLRFNNDNTGINLVATDSTSSITIDKCSFEGVNHTLKNQAQLYIRNTYFGDQNQIIEDTSEPDYIVKAGVNSKTYFRDCRIGMVNRAYTTGTSAAPVVTGVAVLSGTDSTPCEVYLSGGLVEISNNNYAAASAGVTTLYTSTSAKNKVFVDDVDFIPSTGNENHNRIPYYLYDGYSCLASVNPVQNYVLNGNFSNSSANALTLNGSAKRSFDANLTNPFGGKVLNVQPDDTLTLKYKIPKKLIGVPMTLEFYVSNCSDGYVRLNRAGSDCSESGDVYFGKPAIAYANRTPKVIRTSFTPTKEIGNISFINVWNAPASLVLAGVILKEEKYKYKLSCYEEATKEIYSSAFPTIGTWSVGDKVYNLNPTAGGFTGWICTVAGTPGTWKGFGLIEA